MREEDVGAEKVFFISILGEVRFLYITKGRQVVCKQTFLCKQVDWRGQPLLVDGRKKRRARKG